MFNFYLLVHSRRYIGHEIKCLTLNCKLSWLIESLLHVTSGSMDLNLAA